MQDVLLTLLVFGGGLMLLAGLVMRAFGVQHGGLAAAGVLAAWLVLGLSVAMPSRWQAWLGDGVWLLLVLGLGALAWRNRHTPFTDMRYTGWRFDALLLAFAVVLMSVPALVLPVPLDTDAQGFGYLALTTRLHGDLSNLAPLNPEINYLYAGGFSVTVAYLSERLGTALHSTQFAVGAVLAVLLLVMLYDFGRVLGGRVLARAQVIAALIGTGLFTAYMDSHYTSLYGLVFGVAFLMQIYRLWDATSAPRVHIAAAALFLAALVLVHPDTTIIIGLGFGAWLLLVPLANPRPSRVRWLLATFAVPALALVLVAAWLWSVRDLLGGHIQSPFERYPDYWRVVLSVPPQTLYHGVAGVLLALVGVVLGLRKRVSVAWLSVGWVLLILDFSTFGLLEYVAAPLVALVTRYDYPFSIAWHGPIVPYALMGGLALVALWERLPARERLVHWGTGALAVGIACGLIAGVFNTQILALSKGRITFFGAFASHADVAAMTWLRENSAPDAYVLNFPPPQEGDWVPVIAERRSVYYRPQPFFDVPDVQNPLDETAEQLALRAFWENPSDPAHAALLASFGVDYVIVPQVVGNPASFAQHYRWRTPFTELIDMQSAVADAPYLSRVFDADGAQVYALTEP